MIAGQQVAIKPWRWALLLFELALFAIILILPQVDLPDFTFHGGTAPVAAKSRVCQAQARTVVVSTMSLLSAPPRPEVLKDKDETFTFGGVHERLSLLCALLC
jgi:hypothetical protein